jgi:UDP-N-acetylmuramate: L-alanyl-gamma-D-glutamyl-meso-diaminopimelate ligase
MSTLLDGLGVPLFLGYRPENLDWQPDRVVVGNICRKDHPEAVAARERGLRLTSFPALLSELFLATRHSLVVAGTHGKTTTTALAAHVLRVAGADPGFLVGGIPVNMGRSFGLGSPPYFVIEGDEYDTAFFDKRPKFVHYQPRSVILTSVEFDHADIYPTMADVERAFSMLIERVPKEGVMVVCADYPSATRLCAAAQCPVETYSLVDGAMWHGRVVERKEGFQRLAVSRNKKDVGQFEIPLSGAHNMANALAVVASLTHLGLQAQVIGEGMESFRSVKRRQEVLGVVSKITVIDDFAHHPTAIRETISGLRQRYEKGRMVAVFEPRSATSRRRVLQDELVQALCVADEVVIASLHMPEGIPPEERLDVARVVEEVRASGVPAYQLERVEDIVSHLVASSREDDVIIVMSSGGFGGLLEKLLDALRSVR